MAPLVSLLDVTVAFAGRRVLGPLSIEIAPGEHWAIFGPNGCGKTTLLNLMGAQHHPTSGVASVLGRRIGATDLRTLRREIGVVGHSVSDLLPMHVATIDIVLTGKGSLLAPWWGTFDDEDRARARGLLARFRLSHLASQPLGRCSQGERQRVLLARSLMADHRLLLFDEPMVGVDLPGREALIAALDDLAARASSVGASVQVAHTLEEVPPSTTRVLLLRGGEVVACGATDEVLRDEPLSACFGQRLVVQKNGARFSAQAAGSW